jgi:hypothetical protein
MNNSNNNQDYTEFQLVRTNKKYSYGKKHQNYYKNGEDDKHSYIKGSFQGTKTKTHYNQDNNYYYNNGNNNGHFYKDKNFFKKSDKNNTYRNDHYFESKECFEKEKIDKVSSNDLNKYDVNSKPKIKEEDHLKNKPKLSFSKIHEYAPKQTENIQISDNCLSQEHMMNQLNYNFFMSQFCVNQFNYFQKYANIQMCQPPIIQKKNSSFLNHDKKFLGELNNNLIEECKTINKTKNNNKIDFVKNESYDLSELRVEAKKISEQSEEILSNTTNEEDVSHKSLSEERSICVIIKISDNISKQLIINEKSELLQIAKTFCKENNLKESLTYSIYKSIKLAFLNMEKTTESKSFTSSNELVKVRMF